MRQLKHKSFICNALNCLNEENKNFSNSLFLPLYLIFFSSTLILCLYINMRQLKCIGFICNIYNYLNEENKMFTNFLSSSLFIFLFSFSYFLFILFEMYLINILMKIKKKKKKSSLYLIFFLSSHTLCLYLNVRQLNEENKSFSNYLFVSLYLIFFSFFFSCFMPRIATHGVLDANLLVRQLKHNDFICNALNCLNEKKK
jgi:hypothetical protein